MFCEGTSRQSEQTPRLVGATDCADGRHGQGTPRKDHSSTTKIHAARIRPMVNLHRHRIPTSFSREGNLRDTLRTKYTSILALQSFNNANEMEQHKLECMRPGSRDITTGIKTMVDKKSLRMMRNRPINEAKRTPISRRIPFLFGRRNHPSCGDVQGTPSTSQIANEPPSLEHMATL